MLRMHVVVILLLVSFSSIFVPNLAVALPILPAGVSNPKHFSGAFGGAPPLDGATGSVIDALRHNFGR